VLSPQVCEEQLECHQHQSILRGDLEKTELAQNAQSAIKTKSWQELQQDSMMYTSEEREMAKT
jgi:hypothetical protein